MNEGSGGIYRIQTLDLFVHQPSPRQSHGDDKKTKHLGVPYQQQMNKSLEEATGLKPYTSCSLRWEREMKEVAWFLHRRLVLQLKRSKRKTVLYFVYRFVYFPPRISPGRHKAGICRDFLRRKNASTPATQSHVSNTCFKILLFLNSYSNSYYLL
jgi:hypothetical protein